MDARAPLITTESLGVGGRFGQMNVLVFAVVSTGGVGREVRQAMLSV